MFVDNASDLSKFWFCKCELLKFRRFGLENVVHLHLFPYVLHPLNSISLTGKFNNFLIQNLSSRVKPLLFLRGLSCPRSVQTSLTQISLKLTILGFPNNLLPVACRDSGLKKNLGLVFAWKSGLKAPLLSLGSSCPLQTILWVIWLGVTALCR